MKPLPLIICALIVVAIFISYKRTQKPVVVPPPTNLTESFPRPVLQPNDSIRRAEEQRALDAATITAEPRNTKPSIAFPCNGVDVSVAVETYVKRQLKSPSTADFPWYTDDFLKRDKDGYTYISYVDSQNGFGATIRTYFKAWVHCTGESVVIDDIKYE